MATCNWFGTGDRSQQKALETSSFVAAVGPEHVLPSGAECPWIVRVAQGQRINVTVHLGSLAPSWMPADSTMDETVSSSIGSGFSSCSVLAVEVGDRNRTALLAPPCGQQLPQQQQQQRYRTTYSSLSNELKVFVRVIPLDGDAEDDISIANSGGFLLHFQGIRK